MKVKKTLQNAVLPKVSLVGDAGFDLTAAYLEIRDNQYIYDTGIALEIPKGYFGLLAPRSSIIKTCLRLANSVGILDSNYRGSVKVVFDKIDNSNGIYPIGDRIAQVILVPFYTPLIELVDELSDSNRGSGGFGSSGR